MSELSDQVEREVLELLVDRSPLQVIDIAKTVNRHPITVDQTCARLHDCGYIIPLGQGIYKITDRGTQQVRNERDS